MSAYVIEVWDDKYGITSPNIVGPFSDADAAYKFANDHAMGRQAQDGRGGYSDYHVISDDTSQSPQDWHDDWWEMNADYYDADDPHECPYVTDEQPVVPA